MVFIVLTKMFISKIFKVTKIRMVKSFQQVHILYLYYLSGIFVCMVQFKIMLLGLIKYTRISGIPISHIKHIMSSFLDGGQFFFPIVNLSLKRFNDKLRSKIQVTNPCGFSGTITLLFYSSGMCLIFLHIMIIIRKKQHYFMSYSW